MNFDDDYLRDIAKRRAANMKRYGVNWEKSKLKRYGWSIKEISMIIKYEREILEGNET